MVALIVYRTSKQSEDFNSGVKERIFKMVEGPVDPLEPPKFKHKRFPKASGSPPVPIMHSPPRPLTVKDQQDWKIPPCVSNWKNPKGYAIPLDKRLAADGRALQDVQISHSFCNLSEALCVAEQKAREDVAVRSKVQNEMMMKSKEKQEMELRELAQKVRLEITGAASSAAVQVPSERVIVMNMDYERGRDGLKETREEREERLQRERIREQRREEKKRKRRLEAKDAAMGKRTKVIRDQDRDFSEKVALGMAFTGAREAEVMIDQRLLNQEKGMDSGFVTDDTYNIYDKSLFNSQSTMSMVYRPKKDADDEMYGRTDEHLEKLMKTDRFKAHKQFSGTSKMTGPRDRPVEFEKDHPAEEDPFGLDQFFAEVKKGKKAMDKIGCSGTMKAGAGSMRDDFEGLR